MLKLRLELRQLRKEKKSPSSPGAENKAIALDRRATAWWMTEDGRFLKYMNRHYRYAPPKEGGRMFRFRGDKWLPETIESLPFYESLRPEVND